MQMKKMRVCGVLSVVVMSFGLIACGKKEVSTTSNSIDASSAVSKVSEVELRKMDRYGTCAGAAVRAFSSGIKYEQINSEGLLKATAGDNKQLFEMTGKRVGKYIESCVSEINSQMKDKSTEERNLAFDSCFSNKVNAELKDDKEKSYAFGFYKGNKTVFSASPETKISTTSLLCASVDTDSTASSQPKTENTSNASAKYFEIFVCSANNFSTMPAVKAYAQNMLNVIHGGSSGANAYSMLMSQSASSLNGIGSCNNMSISIDGLPNGQIVDQQLVDNKSYILLETKGISAGAYIALSQDR